MRRILLAATASLALAACGSSSADADGDGEISMEEAAAKSKDLVKPQPGKYRATVEMVSIDMPGASEQVKNVMRQMMDQGPQIHEYCLSAEDAEKGFEEMARQSQQNGNNCSFEKFDADGGEIDAIMNCSAPGDGSARMTMKGTGSETSSQMTMTMDATGPGGQTMKMTMKNSQERIGDCDA